MNMNSHQLSFHDLATFLFGKFVENFAEVFSQANEDHLLSLFGNKHNVILTIPASMAQTPVVWHG